MKKRAPRFYLDDLVKIIDYESREDIGYLLDISETGVSLMSDGELTVNESYTLTLKIPSAHHGGAIELIDIEALVINVKKSHHTNKYVIGLRYMPVNIKSETRLDRFLLQLQNK